MFNFKSLLRAPLAFGFIAAAGTLGAPAFAEGDAAKGERVFKRCMTCHMVGDSARNKVGPVLTGVIGRQAGTYEGFRYGDSLKAVGDTGMVWTEEEIFTYLENPRAFLADKLDDRGARSKMAFQLRKESDRLDVIAYLATFSPAAAEEEAEADPDASR